MDKSRSPNALAWLRNVTGVNSIPRLGTLFSNCHSWLYLAGEGLFLSGDQAFHPREYDPLVVRPWRVINEVLSTDPNQPWRFTNKTAAVILFPLIPLIVVIIRRWRLSFGLLLLFLIYCLQLICCVTGTKFCVFSCICNDDIQSLIHMWILILIEVRTIIIP